MCFSYRFAQTAIVHWTFVIFSILCVLIYMYKIHKSSYIYSTCSSSPLSPLFFLVRSMWSFSWMRTCLSLGRSLMKGCLRSCSVLGLWPWLFTRQLSMNDWNFFDLKPHMHTPKEQMKKPAEMQCMSELIILLLIVLLRIICKYARLTQLSRYTLTTSLTWVWGQGCAGWGRGLSLGACHTALKSKKSRSKHG